MSRSIVTAASQNLARPYQERNKPCYIQTWKGQIRDLPDTSTGRWGGKKVPVEKEALGNILKRLEQGNQG